MPDRDDRQIAVATTRLSGRRKFAPGRYLHHTEPLTEEEWEFAKALQDFKESTGNFFPTSSEVLRLLKSIGYTKLVA